MDTNWRKIIRNYNKVDLKKSNWQLITSLCLYVFAWFLAYEASIPPEMRQLWCRIRRIRLPDESDTVPRAHGGPLISLLTKVEPSVL